MPHAPGHSSAGDVVDRARKFKEALERAREKEMVKLGLVSGERNERGKLVDAHGTEIRKSSGRPLWYSQEEWNAKSQAVRNREKLAWNEYLMGLASEEMGTPPEAATIAQSTTPAGPEGQGSGGSASSAGGSALAAKSLFKSHGIELPDKPDHTSFAVKSAVRTGTHDARW